MRRRARMAQGRARMAQERRTPGPAHSSFISEGTATVWRPSSVLAMFTARRVDLPPFHVQSVP